MKKYIILSVSLFSFAVLSSCNEEHSHSGPEVNITAPTSGQQVASGDSITITATVMHEDELHEYDVRVIRVDDRTELFSFEDHTHDMQLNISQQWTNNVSDTADLRVIVRANDHAGNAGADSVDFVAYP